MNPFITRAASFAVVFVCTTGVAAAQAPSAQAPPAKAPSTQAAPAPSTVDQAIEQLRKDARTEINAIIGSNMQFTSDEAATFWPLYKAYEARRKTLVDERIALVKDYAQNYASMTDAKAAELVQRALALEEKAGTAKRGFVAELQKALPAKTAARFYQVHTRIDLLVDLMLSTEVPLVR